MSYTHSGQRVYFGALPVASTTLDLRYDTGGIWTGIPDTRPVVAYLRVLSSAVGSAQYGVKPDGEPSNWFSAGNRSQGVSISYGRSASADVALVCCPTAAGQIEIIASAGMTAIIELQGWADIEEWTDVLYLSNPLPALVGEVIPGPGERSWVCLRYDNGGVATEAMSVQPSDLPGIQYLTVNNTQGCHSAVPSVARTGCLSTVTAATGEIRLRSATGAMTGQVEGMMVARAGMHWTHLRSTVVPAWTPPPAAFAVIDTGVGRRTVVNLRVRREPIIGAGTLVQLYFRPNGDAGSYATQVGKPSGTTGLWIDANGIGTIEVETDAAGQIQWYATSVLYGMSVVVEGCFNRPPTVSGPAGTVFPTSDRLWTFADPNLDDAVDATSIQIWMTGPEDAPPPYNAEHLIYDGGAGGWQGVFGGNIAALGNGWIVTCNVHPDWWVGDWTTRAICADMPGEATEGTSAFSVDTFPVELLYPEPEGPVSSFAKISCRLVDTSSYGIDLATLRVTVRDSITPESRAMVVIDGGAFQAGWDGVLLGDGAADPVRLDIQIREWPEEIEYRHPPRLWTFEVTGQTIIGKEI